MSIKLENGYHVIRAEESGSPALSVWVHDGEIKVVNVHTRESVDLETVLYTPQNVKTRKSTAKQTTNHDFGKVSKSNVVTLTQEVA